MNGVEALLREVRRGGSEEDDDGVRRLVEWLHRQTGAGVALVTGESLAVEAFSPGFPSRVLPSLGVLLSRLSAGELGAAATRSGELHVRCEALGRHLPRPVLVLAGRSEPSAENVALASHTGGVLALLRRAGHCDLIRRDYQHKAQQMRFAVLHALLAGDVLLARRMTTGAVPPLLEAGRARVLLLRCPSPGDRDRISRFHQDAEGYHGRALMVHCPVFKEHLICLVAEDEEPDGVGEAVRGLVDDHPRFTLGVSGAHPLGGLSEAYGQATHALAAARAAPGRVAYYHGRTALESVLPMPAAGMWARELLRPLESVPGVSVEVGRMSLTVPRSGAAQLLGLSRNTVTAHLRRVQEALGLDLNDVHSRAVVHLAMALAGSARGFGGSDSRPVPRLEELLGGQGVLAWAQGLLRPLPDRHRSTLRGWVEAGADAQRAAAVLGISRNTVRSHLRAAEGVLGLDLLGSGAGVHDVVHALRITAAEQI